MAVLATKLPASSLHLGIILKIMITFRIRPIKRLHLHKCPPFHLHLHKRPLFKEKKSSLHSQHILSRKFEFGRSTQAYSVEMSTSFHNVTSESAAFTF